MTPAFRIAIAAYEPAAVVHLHALVVGTGHEVAATANSAEELMRQCELTSPDLIVADLDAPELVGFADFAAVFQRTNIPLLVASASTDDAVFQQVRICRPYGFLLKPIRERELCAVIVLAIDRYQEIQSYRSSASDMRQALADRKTIERAKGLLMKQCMVDENEAHKRLQKVARDNRQKLAAVAQSIVLAAQALDSHAEPCRPVR